MNEYFKRYIFNLSNSQKENIMKRVLLPPVDERLAEVYRRLLAGQSPYFAAGEMSKLGYGARSTLIYHAERVSANIMGETGLSPEVIAMEIIEKGQAFVPTIWVNKIRKILSDQGYFASETKVLRIDKEEE